MYMYRIYQVLLSQLFLSETVISPFFGPMRFDFFAGKITITVLFCESLIGIVKYTYT